jgi:hypothetical protein
MEEEGYFPQQCLMWMKLACFGRRCQGKPTSPRMKILDQAISPQKIDYFVAWG